MSRSIVASLMIVLGSAGIARAPSRTEVLWIVSGGGVGFGVGLWAGLTAFDDAVNSDRKVWTSAIVGAGVGAAGGYLIGRARTDRSRPSIARNEVDRARRRLADARLLEHLAKSFRFKSSAVGTLRNDWLQLNPDGGGNGVASSRSSWRPSNVSSQPSPRRRNSVV